MNKENVSLTGKDITGKRFVRDVKFVRETINQDERTVELAFSSEEPVERYWGMEILSHATGAIRLNRLKDNGPVLVDHNITDPVAVIISVSIGSDRKGRAVVRFGKSARANEVFQDVIDGIRSKVSVGYIIHAMELSSKEDDIAVYLVTDWEPIEISIVAVPADPSVGVGRSAEHTDNSQTEIHQNRKGNITMSTAENNSESKPVVASTAENDALRNEVRSTELKRIQDITSIGKKFERHGGVSMAQSFISNGKTVDEFRAALIAELGKTPVPSAEIGLNDKEVRQFSFVKAINALASPKDQRAQEAAAFEMEVSRAAGMKSQKEVKGILIPIDVLRAEVIPMRRDLTKGSATAGGHLVGTDLIAGSFIDLLRNKMVLQRLGVTTLNGLVGNIALSRQTSGATAYWVAESGSVTESQQAFDQVTMSPKTIGALTDISRKLLIQSSIDVDNLVKMDLIKQIAIEVDRVGLYGSGSTNQPLGIKDTTGINTKDFAANAPTWAEIVDLETLVADDNADIGTLAYLVNPTGRGSLKTTEKASNTGQFIWEQGNTVNGYRTEVSKQVAANDYLFGNWSDVIMGFWSGIDMIVDPYTSSASATVRVVCHQDLDVAVRHPESFCRGNNTL